MHDVVDCVLCVCVNYVYTPLFCIGRVFCSVDVCDMHTNVGCLVACDGLMVYSVVVRELCWQYVCVVYLLCVCGVVYYGDVCGVVCVWCVMCAHV